MPFDLRYYKNVYFYYDLPVEYQLRNGQILKINPIKLIDGKKFLICASLLMIDKNSSSSVEIIQMSYLEFIYRVLLQDKNNKYKFAMILQLCFGITNSKIGKQDNKIFIMDSNSDIVIDNKDFDVLRKIILYQNIPNYDEEYINPELKQAMQEEDLLKNKNIEPISPERKIAIITAHCGLSKKEQLEMTYRSHCLLFNEVCGEVEFTTKRLIALFGGKGSEMDHWIYKKKKNKLDGYLTDINTYTQALGGEDAISSVSTTNTGEYYDNLFNKNK